MSQWWVYVIRSRSGKLYTGISTDVERRFRQHAGELAKGARFFRGDPPECVVYREAAENRSAASKREAHIKHLARSQKIKLITGTLTQEQKRG